VLVALLTSLLVIAPAAGGAADKGFVPKQNEAPGGQKRVALIIGNGAYKGAPLKNPARDAKAMARTLATIGFDVDAQFDLDRPGMLRALRRFAERLDKDSVALFYFSGHGITHDGRSYMLPVATDIRTAADVDLEGVDLRRVTARLEEVGSRLNIVILDACRNNPLLYADNKSSGGGLAFTTAPTGTLIAYATAPGQTAADGRGQLSPYTWALTEELTVPGRPIEEVFKAVRRRVRKASKGGQVPWESSSLEGRFVFVPEGWTPTPIAPDENEVLATAVDRVVEAEATPPTRRRVSEARPRSDDRLRVQATRQALLDSRQRAARAEALATEVESTKQNVWGFAFTTAAVGGASVLSLLVSGGAALVLSASSQRGATVDLTTAEGAPLGICALIGLGGCALGLVGLLGTLALTVLTVRERNTATELEEKLERVSIAPAPSERRAMAY
jgi:uncharacterized caspase-like protein